MTDYDLIFKILQAAAIVGGGLYLLFRLGRAVAKFEEAINVQNTILTSQAKDVLELKGDVQRFAAVLTTIAVQDHRMDRIEEDIRELKHARGFIKEP